MAKFCGFQVILWGLLVMVLVGSCAKSVKTDEAGSFNAAATSSAAPAAASVDEDNDLKKVYFAVDKATIQREGRQALMADVAWLKKNPTTTVQIEGNCDERGSADYNMNLGRQRAVAVRTFLTKHGIKAKRLTTVSYGKDKPVDSGHDESAWSQNRRAAFRMGSAAPMSR